MSRTRKAVAERCARLARARRMAACALWAWALAAQAGGQAALPDAGRAGAGADYARFAREMDQGMQRMMHDMHAAGYSGDPDADFLAMMIAHHQGAVDMARLQLIHGRDPLARALAEEIIAGQTTEIAAMRARLARLRNGGDAEPDGFPALGATRGAAPTDAAAVPRPAAAGALPAAPGALHATPGTQGCAHGPGCMAH